MSYNGSGTFNINTTGQPVVAGTVISSSSFNSLTNDLATGLTTAITKDGQTTTTARITFAQGLTSSLTTDSSSISTGSIITAGGAGIAKNLYVGVNANVAGTLGVTGVATFSAAPIYSSLTASSAVATDASKGLVSVTNTGTGNNVLATSPTLVTPALGTPASGVMTNVTAIPAAQITGSQAIPKSTLPTGSVLQVVNATYASETSTTSASYADTGLTVSITPTSSSSKILVLISQRFFANVANGNDGGGNVKVLRGATTLITATRVGLSDSTGAMDNYFTTSYLDSPATTSSITYKTQFAIFGTLGAFITQLSSSPSGITLMEISA